MGARTLEERLRARLLAVIAPALVGVGGMAVAATAYVFDAADRRSAMDRAVDALHALEAERREGDSLDDAAAEVLGAEADGVRIALRAPHDGAWRAGDRRMPTTLLSLAPGTCGLASDADGETRRGCAAGDSSYEAIAAVSVGGHRRTLWSVARAVLGMVVLTLLGVVWAAARAVKSTMQSLTDLVLWSERIGDQVAPAAPRAETADVERLVASFNHLVERLFEALARERASSAHIAHELRTPLTSILAELDALPNGPARGRVRADVEHLARVVEAILVLSDLPGRRRVDRVVNVADLARELAPAQTVVDAPDEALVDGDADLITLALRNVLENARKYSGREALTVRVSKEGRAVRVAVIDDGPGANPETCAKMFDRHWRASSDRPGSGLGLALVRAVTEHHGGNVSATSNAGGKGLEVTMTLGDLVGWHDERR